MEREKPSTLIGKKIRFYRKLRGYTQEQLAATISCCKSTVAKYEAGSITLDVDTCAQIARALQVSLAQLLTLPESDVYDMPDSSSRRNGIFHASRLYLYNLTLDGSVKKSLIILDPNSDDAFCYFDLVSEDPLCSLYYYHGKAEFYHSLARFTFVDQNSPFDQTIITFPNMTGVNGYYVGYANTVIQPSYSPAIVKMLITPNAEAPTSIFQECTASKEEIAFYKQKNYFVPNIKWWY